MAEMERRVEKYLDSEVKKIGGLTRKWENRHHAGVPDRIVVTLFGVWFVEVKTAKGKLSKMQERERDKLNEVLPNHCVTVYGKSGVDKFIRDLDYEQIRQEEYR